MLKSYIGLFILSTVLSQAGYYWQIKNKDMKALCKSKFEHKKNCWLIKEHDLQMMYKAVLGV